VLMNRTLAFQSWIKNNMYTCTCTSEEQMQLSAKALAKLMKIWMNKEPIKSGNNRECKGS